VCPSFLILAVLEVLALVMQINASHAQGIRRVAHKKYLYWFKYGVPYVLLRVDLFTSYARVYKGDDD
jgi:hypothetical protein